MFVQARAKIKPGLPLHLNPRLALRRIERGLFDLETTTARIKEHTAHLKGLEIAVMGYVVNGPGEMADADFGYVGRGDDKIALFVGKDMVEKDIRTSQVADRLVERIKHSGKWIDPHAVGGDAA